MNGRLHTRCPRATFLENIEARAIVEAFYACKNFNQWPAEGGFLAQTSFTIEIFNYINGVIAEAEERIQREAASKNRQ